MASLVLICLAAVTAGPARAQGAAIERGATQPVGGQAADAEGFSAALSAMAELERIEALRDVLLATSATKFKHCMRAFGPSPTCFGPAFQVCFDYCECIERETPLELTFSQVVELAQTYDPLFHDGLDKARAPLVTATLAGVSECRSRTEQASAHLAMAVPATALARGQSQDVVRRLRGEPVRVQRVPLLDAEAWIYPSSYVLFAGSPPRVIGYYEAQVHQEQE